MLKIVEMSHLFIKEYINNHSKEKLIIVDATCGMGNDSLFIGKLLNNKSRLYCYDIQEKAIVNTNKLLLDNNINNVTIFFDSHENIDLAHIDLIIFNLGYLPNTEKIITTKSETTLNTIKKLLLKYPKISILICVYPGHKEGYLESIAINDFVHNLPSNLYLVSKYQNYNQNKSPYLLTISSKKV